MNQHPASMRPPIRHLGIAVVVLLLTGAGVDSTRTASADAAPAAPVPPPSTDPLDDVVAVATVDSAEGDATLEESVAGALAALAPHVRVSSDEDALRMAFRAYFAYRAEHPERVTKPYFYYVDYGLPNSAARGWVFDMDALAVVDGPFTVAHGRGSSRSRNGVPMTFGNRSGSAMTSLGLYVTQETYAFSGRAGGGRYRSVGLRMAGVSGRFNDAARSRGVVAHGAPYVGARDAGRSEGCPAMEEFRAQRLLPLIARGSLVFLFSPNDENWRANDPWAGGA